MSKTSLLTVENLAFERNDSLLFRGVSFSVSPGDILQIEGPNGCGKTTLLRLLTTALQPTEGEVLYRGKAVSQCRYEYLSDILYIGHQPAVKLSLTAEENLRWMKAGLAGKTGLTVAEALSRVGLMGYEDVPCYTLSAGQHRRVALARLLMAQAKLWYLDEPFTAIDKQGVSFLETCMQAHVANGGAIVLSTHQDIAIESVRKYSFYAQFEKAETVA